jgi:aminopeptidase N
MEHQSAIAYGNNFEPGYRGSDLSGSGWGLKWDFIVVHESGHEWYGNNLTTYDLADMWVHESFTSYSETLYIECMYGPDAATDYVVGTRKNIQNDRPVIGPYSVNREGSGDMYYKGANMLHTIRQLFSSTEEFRLMLRDMNSRWRHSIVSSVQVEAFLSKRAGRDLAPIFDQYLRTTLIPVFETAPCEGGTQYRYTNVVPGFNLPLRLGNGTWIHPTAEWQCAQGLTLADCMPDRSFYVKLK